MSVMSCDTQPSCAPFKPDTIRGALLAGSSAQGQAMSTAGISFAFVRSN